MYRTMRVFAFSLLCTLSISGAGSVAEPDAVVSQLQEVLLDSMKEAGALGYSGRYQRLEPVVIASHDLPFIAKTAAGRHWSKLTEDERQAFISAFTRLTVGTYANRFNGYSGEHFEIGQRDTRDNGQMVVHSTLTKADGGIVKFDYVLRETDAQWRIVNIVYDGISDLALKRAEYGAIIAKGGMAALLQQIDAQIAAHTHTPP